MFVIEFDAVALVLLTTTLYVFYLQKKIKDTASFRFEMLLWVSFGSALFDFISASVINDTGRHGIAAAYATNFVFYLFHSSIPITVASYVAAISGKSFKSRIGKALFILPYLTVLALIVANIWNRWIFFFDEQGRYRHGIGLAAPYIMVFIYIAFSLYLMKTRRSSTSKLARYALPGLFIIPGLAILLQNVFNGMLLECFAISVSMLLVLFTIQNSNELIDRECGLFNRTAFTKFAGTRLDNGVPFDLILLRIKNEALLRHMHKQSRIAELHGSVAIYLSSIAGRSIGGSDGAFYLEDGCFALILEGKAAGAHSLNTALEIKQHFAEEGAAASPTELELQICRLRCPEEAAELTELFDCLDQMGVQLFSGRNAQVLSAADLNMVNKKRQAAVEKVIVSALDAGHIRVLYQPVYSVREKRVVFADAQAVLADEDGSLIHQRELFRVAEHNGSMQRLGILALNSVCSFFSAGELGENGIRNIQLRLSGAQCMQSDLSQQVLAVLAAHAVDPRHICFQITETAAVNTPDIMNSNMRTLSEQGTTFALDDYGSGYTDLNYIMDLPFSLIKLDKSIIRAGFKGAAGRVAMESTVALIKRLNRNIVAEGVESREQAELLTDLGCDYLQGYYFSKPLNETEFIKFLSV